MLLIKDKKALITGGTSGLGKAIALRFAAEGARVCIWGTNESKAKNVASINNAIEYDCIDVSSKKSVDQGYEALLKKWEQVDIIVNCAGITRDQLLMKMSEEDWDRVIDVNLKSIYNVCHAAIRPMMKVRSGSIINISSVIGLTGNPGQVNYAASKLGMIGFTRSLAKEVAKRGIRVNCIAPGFFPTEMTDALSEQVKEAILSQVPMGRLGDPNDIANAALFLASSMSEYITGQVITVDGGMLA